MTGKEFAALAAKYVGYKESDGSHKKIIDIYNAHAPLARNYKVKYTDAWCATFVSAMAILAGVADRIPTECSCGYMVKAFQALGTWMESDSYTPSPGDVIFYDWEDNGKGDNTGAPDHVGIVEAVSGETITVIEGNKSNAVGRRSIQVNGRYIRGYGLPKFAETSAPAAPVNVEFKAGDSVIFTGNTHYASSISATGFKCVGGPARVTKVASGAPHPYHLVASGGKATVEGWVDAADVVSEEITSGDIVEFAGGPQYISANSPTPASGNPGAGPAKVTAVKTGAAHPYHIIHTDAKSNVYGWVDAGLIKKEG